MRKLLVISLLVLATLPVVALAQAQCSPGYAGTRLCNALPTFGGAAVNNIPSFIAAALSWLATVIGTLALVMVLFSGAQMLFSAGDPQAVTRAKSSLTYSIYGLVIVMFAYVIVSGVQYFIGFNNGINPGDIRGGFFFNPLRDTNLLTFVEATVADFLGIMGTFAIFYIVYSGFRYITSAGNEEQAKKARAGLQWAVLGLICIILSYVLLTVVINSVIGASAA